jgi:hypothetical protein
LKDWQWKPEPDAKVLPPSLLAPRVNIARTETGQAIEPILNGTVNPEDFHAAFLAAFDEVVAEALLGQLLNGLHTEPR